MDGRENEDVGFQHGGEDDLHCPSLGMSTNPLPEKISGMIMSSVSMYKPSNGADPFFSSGWDPLASLSQNQNFGGSSSTVSHSEFANPPYPIALENQGTSSTGQLVRYPSNSSFVELVQNLPCFGSGSFSEMANSFGFPDCGQIANSGCPQNYASLKEGGTGITSTNGALSRDDPQISCEGAIGSSPNAKRRKRASDSKNSPITHQNAEGELQKSLSRESSDVLKEPDEKKPRIEHSKGSNLRGKQAGKQAKDTSSGDASRENYIHVRARRGQATNSHSLAERVRREKISERMRLLQELVPGCNKITGKAVMLDEIINYVQSLQQQVEFLSMKLATVNPELNIDIEQILSKEIIHSRGGAGAILGLAPAMNSSHHYPHGIFQGTFPSIPSTTPKYPLLPQTVLDNELQSLFQVGFNSCPAVDNLGSNGNFQRSA